jgi:hypothetical protein
MGNETHKRFSAVDRRISYLRQELYTYDKFLRNPSEKGDVGASAKWAIDADDYQRELDELSYLRDVVDGASKPSPMTRWQAGLILFFASVAIGIAVLSLYVATG